MEFFVYDSLAFQNFLEANPHEGAEVKFLKSIVKEGMTVVDVGANIGITTVTIAKKVGGKGKVYAFEPLRGYFDVLKKNLSANGLKNVKAFELALVGRVGRIDFYENELSSSIVSRGSTNKTIVSATSLDNFLGEQNVERIDLINMDCEGSELLVLKGAERTLQKNKVKIFCEIHHDVLEELGQSVGDIVEYLQRLGLEVHSVSLDDLKIGNDFEDCEYIYAY
jgi:FkbM family methyltransferase